MRMPETKKLSQEDRVWGAVSYFWILGLVALAARKDNDFIRFHANQGVFLFLVSLVGFIPVFGWLVSLAALILMIVGIIKAWQGEKWELPLVAGTAKDLGDWIINSLKL